MKKKRTSLDSLFENKNSLISHEQLNYQTGVVAPSKKILSNRSHVKQQTVYLPLPIYEQLRKIAFEERKKMHDYIMEGLDLIFKNKGLASIEELKSKR